MKFTLTPLLLLAGAFLTTAAPTSSAAALTEPIPNADAYASALAEARALASAPHLEKRLNAAECRAACRGGAEAMERVCRLVPVPWVRAVCWGIAAGVQTPAGLSACTAFCDWAV